MKFTCVECDGEFEIADDILDGEKFECPHCGLHMSFENPNQTEVFAECGRSTELSSNDDASRMPSHRHSDLYVRRPTKTIGLPLTPPPVPPHRVVARSSRSSATSTIRLFDLIVYIILLIVAIGIIFYLFIKSTAELPTGQVVGDVALDIEQVVNDEREKKLAEERACDDAKLREARARRMANDEAERKRRHEERLRRDAERDNEYKELERKAECERQFRDLVLNIEMGFSGAASVFASDFPENVRPFGIASNGVIDVADVDYVVNRVFYKVNVNKGKVQSAQRISPRDGIIDLSVNEFMSIIKDHAVLAKSDSGIVWICGDTKMSELIQVPYLTDSYSPLADFVGEAWPVLNALKVIPPAIKYRVTLKSEDGDGDIKFGIIEKEIDVQAIRSTIREQLVNRRLRRAKYRINPPKLKTYRRTVVFYEGPVVRKEIGGLIKVPRSSECVEFTEWSRLAEEARRQDREERCVEEDNQSAMNDYQRKVDELLRNAKPTEDEVDAELNKCRLLIERNRSKLPKGYNHSKRTSGDSNCNL